MTVEVIRAETLAGIPHGFLGRRGGVSTGTVEHARVAHDAMPGSRLEVFDGAGHFPFHTHPDAVLAALRTFLADTEPARWSGAEWRELLRHGRD